MKTLLALLTLSSFLGVAAATASVGKTDTAFGLPAIDDATATLALATAAIVGIRLLASSRT